jgi:hypothetical protein
VGFKSGLDEVGDEAEFVIAAAGVGGGANEGGVKFFMDEAAEVNFVFGALVWHGKILRL